MPKKNNKKKNKNGDKNEVDNQPLLELVMIVKNDGELIRKCLVENKKYIDYWTILDTGSTDGTPDVIRDILSDVPGQLHFAEFTNFSEARNKAFDLASGKCKYMIVLDDSYEIGEGKALRDYLQKSVADVIYLKIGYMKEIGYLTNLYYSTRITKTSTNIRYMYRVHEALQLPRICKSEYADEKQFYIIDYTSTEHGARTFSRLKRDMTMLLLDKADYPNDPRPVYYLARTSFNLTKWEDTIKYSKMLLDMTNIREYAFYAEYNLILIDFQDTNNKVVYQQKLLDLQKRYTDRAEPSYKLAISFYETGQLDKIEHITDKLIKCPTPQLGMTSFEHDIYEYNIPYLYVEIKLKTKDPKKILQGVEVLKNMLARYPDDQKLLNMKYAICDNLDISHKRLAQKVMVIHTGYVPFTWNPVPGASTKISGSEFMAMYMAKEFRDLGYRVFIFGNFESTKDGVNYQTTLEGIQYCDLSYFSDFCLTYVVDTLIVSRYIDNLVYYDNVKNVYLWVHDILPAGDFRFIQIHETKFKAVICISEWQKRYVLKHTQISADAIYVSRNAIHPKRFLGGVQPDRVPFRFIYTPDPNRGLELFIKMVPMIKARYAQSTFYIFGRVEQITPECMEFITSHKEYVFLSPRVSQEQLVLELQKSDVWLYPSTFEETYCISAVEAMASGCLVASLKVAALCEIVHDRGVLADMNDTDGLFTELCKVLDDSAKKEEIVERGYQWALRQDFHSLAQDWLKLF